MSITIAENLAIELLKSIGRLSATTADKLVNCASVTSLSIDRLLTICGTVSQFELNTLKQAVTHFAEEDFGYLKTVLILRQSIAMYVEYNTLLKGLFMCQLSPVCLYLLERGVLDLSQLQHIQQMSANDCAPALIDGYYLWSSEYISLSQWRQAIIDLRLLELGLRSIEELAREKQSSRNSINLDELFDGQTWLIGEESLNYPTMLNQIEIALDKNRRVPAPRVHLDMSVSRELQRLIVELKSAIRNGQMEAAQARDLARIAYTSPAMIWSLSAYLGAHIEHWQQTKETAAVSFMPVSNNLVGNVNIVASVALQVA